MTEQIQIVHSSCHKHPKRNAVKSISDTTSNTGHVPAPPANPMDSWMVGTMGTARSLHFQRLVVPVSPREMFLLSSLQQTVSRQIGVLLKGVHMNHVLVHLKALCRQTCSLYQQARGCKYFTQRIWALTGHLWCMGLRKSLFRKD